RPRTSTLFPYTTLFRSFVDLFIIGDGEESLPWVMEQWMALKERAVRDGDLSHRRRLEMLAEIAGSTTWAYAPAFYEPEYHSDGRSEEHTSELQSRGHLV